MIVLCLQMLNQEEEFKVGFSSLMRGELYPIVKAEKTESKFYGKTVKGMRLVILDDELEIVTYLPKKCVESINDEDFAKINEAGKTNSKYNVGYYGKLGNAQTVQFVGRGVHSPGQGKLRLDLSKRYFLLLLICCYMNVFESL